MGKVCTVIAYRTPGDPEKRAAYATLAGPAVRQAGGRVIAAGDPLALHEAGLALRVLVIEWDSLEAAEAVYETPAYLAALAALGGTAERDIRIIAMV